MLYFRLTMQDVGAFQGVRRRYPSLPKDVRQCFAGRVQFRSSKSECLSLFSLFYTDASNTFWIRGAGCYKRPVIGCGRPGKSRTFPQSSPENGWMSWSSFTRYPQRNARGPSFLQTLSPPPLKSIVLSARESGCRGEVLQNVLDARDH
jgi:hypothetical protein